MSKIAVVYWSGTGNTEAMAHLVAEGAASSGAEAEVISCADLFSDKAAGYDAIAFGCPAMGSEELEYDEFQPMWDEVKETLGDKKVVLFDSILGPRANGWTTGRRTPTRPASASSIPSSVTTPPTMRQRPPVAPLEPSSPNGDKLRPYAALHQNTFASQQKRGWIQIQPRFLLCQPHKAAMRYCPRTPWCARS